MLAQKSCRKFGLRKLHALRLDEFSKTCLAGQGNASYRVARFWHGAGPRTSSTGAVRRHNKLRFWPMKADEAQEGELLEWLPVARSRVERHPAADVPTHYGASRWDCALGLNTSPKRATRRSRPPTWQSRMLAGQGPRTAEFVNDPSGPLNLSRPKEMLQQRKIEVWPLRDIEPPSGKMCDRAAVH